MSASLEFAPTTQETSNPIGATLKHIAGRIAVCLALGGGAYTAGEIINPESAVAATASVGMPFSGQWAYNQVVQPDSNGNYSDATSSHPSVHHNYYGDWATDVYAGAGTPVKLHVASPDGEVSFSYNRSNDTCSSVGQNIAGRGIVLNVLVNGQPVGSVDYEHLDNISSGPYSNGMTIGNVTSEPLSSTCYQVRHAHMELRNAGSSYACWTDHGNPGTALNEGDSLGQLGSGNTGPHQACTGTPAGPSAMPRMMVIDSAGNVYAKDGLQDGWVLEYNGGNAKSISVGGTGRMMMIDSAGTAWQKDTLTAAWTQQVTGAKQVAVGSTGRMAVIDSAGNAYAKDNPTDPWMPEYTGGGAKDIAVGAIGRMMLVDGASNSYEKETNLSGPWNFQSARASRVAVGGVTGRMMVEDYTGNVYAKDNPGDPWIQEYGNGGAKDIAAGGNGRMMIINSAGAAYQKDTLTGSWNLQASSAQDVAVGTTGRMMLIDGAGNTYAKDSPNDSWTLETSGGGARAVAVG